MTRCLWLTDIHVNHLPPARQAEFLAQLAAAKPQAVLLTGDIAEADTVLPWLHRIQQTVAAPLYFVLGNHDFYRGSIPEVRDLVAAESKPPSPLFYLTTTPKPVRLAPGVGLIGHDGWADARSGDFENSPIFLNDYLMIDELAGLTTWQRHVRLNHLGDEAAEHVAQLLMPALERFQHVVLLTHVPPVRGACWYNGEISDDNWAPHFVCQAVGDVIVKIMRARKQQKLLVLCGHTHSPGVCRPLPNVTILTGGATYGDPEIQREFVFGENVPWPG